MEGRSEGRSKARRGTTVGLRDRKPSTMEEYQAYRTRLNNWAAGAPRISTAR